MATKISNFSDLIQRTTACCLLHPLATRHHSIYQDHDSDSEEINNNTNSNSNEEEEEGEEEEQEAVEETRVSSKSVREMQMLMAEVFEAVWGMKRAYVSLQSAHCPWDPDKIRVADAAVVVELRKLGVLKERFRRSVRRECGGRGGEVELVAPLREVVAPYEAAVEELKGEVKAKEAEVENLKEKLRCVTSVNGSGRKGRLVSMKKLGSGLNQAPPEPELFEATMSQVKETSKSFTSLLLSLMRSARWDISAAVRSIEAAMPTTEFTTTTTPTSVIGAHHAKYALESYISGKLFEGFDHETFYMDGSLSSLINPDQFRRDCFTQYQDMKAMDPAELLGILPTCPFGKFCSKKYLSIVHPKMEESLFGNLEQHRQVAAGNHPRTQFYSKFLEMTKAVWLLHLLAFALDPPPNQVEGKRGADYHPQYMESVIKFSGGRVSAGQIVGFPVSPGFKLGNTSFIKARVYLVSKSQHINGIS